jgi:hypothetical protein
VPYVVDEARARGEEERLNVLPRRAAGRRGGAIGVADGNGGGLADARVLSRIR